jgi:hypothetical protein
MEEWGARAISLKEFGQRHRLDRQARGELFLQLLHLGLPLRQEHPEAFGDILVALHGAPA